MEKHGVGNRHNTLNLTQGNAIAIIFGTNSVNGDYINGIFNSNSKSALSGNEF